MPTVSQTGDPSKDDWLPDPETELGRDEWAYFESRGVKRVSRIADRG